MVIAVKTRSLVNKESRKRRKEISHRKILQMLHRSSPQKKKGRTHLYAAMTTMPLAIFFLERFLFPVTGWFFCPEPLAFPEDPGFPVL